MASVVYSVYMDAESTSEKIAAAARKLLDKEGEEAVTMRRVAAMVGITPMAVYRHYPDRKGLLNALADKGFDELSGRLKAGPSRRISRSGSRRYLTSTWTSLCRIHDSSN